MKADLFSKGKYKLFLISFLVTVTLLLLVHPSPRSATQTDYLRTADGDKRAIYAFNRPRGPDQLIVYTPDYGSRTDTNPWGAEAVVKDGRVTVIRHGFLGGRTDSPIPENGYVISAHGTAKKWLLSHLQKGDRVELVRGGRDSVGILVSGYNLHWYSQMGLEEPDWAYFQEMENLVRTIRGLGYQVVTLSDQDLEQAYMGEKELDRKLLVRLSQIKTLILPNTRRMSPSQVRNVRRFVKNGGTVLALMQASFRDEDDQKVGKGGYQLRDLLGITYDSFSWKPGAHAYIKSRAEHKVWEGVDDLVPIDRGWAMVNGTEDGGKVLGSWYNSDEEPSHPPEKNGAIVEGNRTLYVGEQLLAPSNFQNEEVRDLLRNMVRYLYELEPGVGDRESIRIEAGKVFAEKKRGGDQTFLTPLTIAGVGLVAAIAGYMILS